MAKLKVPTARELSSSGRCGDGPKALEPRNDDDPELVEGTEETVLLMARGRCRCIILVIINNFFGEKNYTRKRLFQLKE